LRRLVNYLIRRLILAVPTLLVLSLIIFSTMTLVPLDERLRLYRSEFQYQHPQAPSNDEMLIAKYHLNDPFIIQWAIWLMRTVSFDLGFSRVMHLSVIDGIFRSFGTTFEIVMYAAPITIFLGYKLGVLSARQAFKKTVGGSAVDKIISFVTTVAYSTPAFLYGLFLLATFYLGFHWSSIGRLGLEAEIFISSSEFTSYTGLHTVDALLNQELWVLYDALQHLTLPVLTLTFTVSPIITRITRASMLDELIKPYTLVARAKGLKEKEVVDRTKKPSLFPVFTVSGIIVATMLTGVVVVERIFYMYGLGYWLVEAATRWDYIFLVNILLLFSMIFIIANIVVDVAYTYLDPRIKL
jgi:peptide/nickel transport system permease protein